MPEIFDKAYRLKEVNYDLRGRLLTQAEELTKDGQKLILLNIGNTAPFGLRPTIKMLWYFVRNIHRSFGYTESKGIPEAREAIMEYYEARGVKGLQFENIFLGNGVSDLIAKICEAFINLGDEILVPRPDYPLWTAKIIAFGGKAVYYNCLEANGWLPDPEDIRSKITPKTKAIVIIPFNNPTGAVYPRDTLQQIADIAREHKLAIFSDEIYDRIIYDGHESVSIASLATDLLIITLNGLAKAYRLPGWRSGWAAISGNTKNALGFIQGIKELCDQSLGANAPGQLVIRPALRDNSITAMTAPGGRLYQQREIGYRILTSIPGITCQKPKCGLYFFPKIDTERFNIKDGEQFLLDFLNQQKVLIGTGKGFNWPQPDHFRVVFLPREKELTIALNRLGTFLSTYRQK